MNTQDDIDDLASAEVKILNALRKGEQLTAPQIAERFSIAPESVKVFISNIRKRRLAPGERIPLAKTGRGVWGEYRLERIEPSPIEPPPA